VSRSGGTAIRIFIADDHPIVRQGLRRIVETDQGLVVSGEAGDAAALFTALQGTATDLVLLDVSMPGGPFLETLRDLRARHPTIRVLVLSVHPEDQWAVRALKAGASGYLTKDHSPDQLLEAIRRVYRGGKYVSPTLAERLATHLDAGVQRAPHELLSDREFEVMRRLGSGLTVSQIATELAISAKTVSTYRARILEKMAVDTNAELVRYAARYGLIA
jgi:DNA-binding NarL/FixJ family response regulator